MRTRHKKSEMPFAEALEFAKKRLTHAQKELSQAQKVVAERSAEIPALQATISALERQLNPSKSGQPVMPPAFQHFAEPIQTEPTEDELLPDPDVVDPKGKELLPQS